MPVTLVPATPKSIGAQGRHPRDVDVAVSHRRAGRELAVDFSTHHHPDDVVTDGVGAGDLSRVPPVLEHGDAIGDGEHLVEAVADEHDRATALAQAPDHGEQALHLVLAQPGRRLVEHEECAVCGPSPWRSR